MTVFIVTIDDDIEADVMDVKTAMEDIASGKDWNVNAAVEQIEVVHDGDSDTQIAGLSYRVVNVA